MAYVLIFFLSKYLEEGLLGHMISICSVLWKTAKLLSEIVVTFYILSGDMKESQAAHSFLLFSFLRFSRERLRKLNLDIFFFFPFWFFETGFHCVALAVLELAL